MGLIIPVESKVHVQQELGESGRIDTPSTHSSNKCQSGSQRRLQSAVGIPPMQAQSAGTPSQNGHQSPFEDVKLGGPDDTWWGANEQLHLQRMQEQEKQRAAQLRHTRAWAEAQVITLSVYSNLECLHIRLRWQHHTQA